MHPILLNFAAHAKLKLKIELLRALGIMRQSPLTRVLIDLISRNEKLYRSLRAIVQWARARDMANEVSYEELQRALAAMTPEAREILEKLKTKIAEIKASQCEL